MIFFLSLSWINIKDTDSSAVTLRGNASSIMMHIRFISQLFTFTKDITYSFVEDTLQDGYFDIILHVFVGTRARGGKFGV